jgi:hypothetical protein
MRLATPGWTAFMAAALAVSIHPALGVSARWPVAAPALALLWVSGLVAQARGQRGRQILALGALIATGGLAFDALRGVTGSLDLAPGESTARFSETGPDGAILGLRPLGLNLRLEERDPGGAAILSAERGNATATLRVTPGHAATAAGLRFGQPVWHAASGEAVLHLAVVTHDVTHEVVVSPAAPTQVGPLVIGLDQYFPDFALDARRQPFSRSGEPRNPGALLRVKRGSEEFRVFVLQALPGIHKQPGLDATFSLTGVEAPGFVRLSVTALPAAPVIAAGLVLCGLGLLLGARTPRRPGETSAATAAALALIAILALADGGRILHWSFGVALRSGRVELAGAGLPLAFALLTGLAAWLLLTVALVSRDPEPERWGQSLLILAATLAGLGTAVGVARLLALPSQVWLAGSAGLAPLALGSVAAALGAARRVAAPAWNARALDTLVQMALPGLGLAWLITGVLAWQQAGRYDTAAAMGATAAVLLAFAAAEDVAASPLFASLSVVATAWFIVA